MRGMKIFLGQFFSKAICRLVGFCYLEDHSSPSPLGMTFSIPISSHSSRPSGDYSIRQPRIKLKIVQNIPLDLIWISSISLTTFYPSRFPQINKIMSRQETAPQKSTGIVSSFVSSTSRITRTPQDNRAPTPQQEKQGLMLKRVGDLDRNVLYQDMDRPQKSSVGQSTNNSRITQSQNNTITPDKSMGLISNVFLGSTNKFVRGGSSIIPSTPEKSSVIVEPELDSQVKQTPQPKFTRNRDPNDSKNKALSIKQSASKNEAPLTDRSQADTKKIERKQGGTRELKFVQKKQEKIDEPQEPELPVKNTIASKLQKTNYTSQKVEQPTPQATFQRVYQPVQRTNPYPNRSRLLSDQYAKQQVPTATTPIIQAPEVISAPTVKVTPISRTANSRIQPVSVSQVETLEQAKQNNSASKPVINRIAQSRLITSKQSNAETTEPPKPEIKPKPYSRSFISRPQEPVEGSTSSSQILTNMSTSQIVQNPISVTQPKKTIEKQVESNISNEEVVQKIALKKGLSLIFALKRLFRNKLIDTLTTLKEVRSIGRRKTKQACLLVYSCSQISKNKESNLLKISFQNIKKKFTAPYITSLKPFIQSPIVNHTNTGLNIIHLLYISKLRDHLNKIKLLNDNSKKRGNNLFILHHFQIKKTNKHLRDAFDAIKNKRNSLVYLTNQVSNIVNNVNKNKLLQAFCKIAGFRGAAIAKPIQSIATQPSRSRAASKVQQPSQQPINNQSSQRLQKLKTQGSSLRTQVTNIQSSLQKKKKTVQTQKNQHQQRITALLNHNEQINNQIQIKKHRNTQIKCQIQTTAPKNHRELEQQLTETRQDRLQILTNIYISNFKNQQELISAQQLIDIYDIKRQDGASIFNQWDAVLNNIQLKRLISGYEGGVVGESKARQGLAVEQGFARRLIRSYVKEIYFWNYIHISAQ